MPWFVNLTLLVLHIAASIVYFCAIHFHDRKNPNKMPALPSNNVNNSNNSKQPECACGENNTSEQKKNNILRTMDYVASGGFILIALMLLIAMIASAVGATVDLKIYMMFEAITYAWVTAYSIDLIFSWPPLANKPYKEFRFKLRFAFTILCIIGTMVAYILLASFCYVYAKIIPILFTLCYIVLLGMGIGGLIHNKRTGRILKVMDWYEYLPQDAPTTVISNTPNTSSKSCTSIRSHGPVETVRKLVPDKKKESQNEDPEIASLNAPENSYKTKVEDPFDNNDDDNL